MDRREAAAVAGVEGLQEVRGLGAADLADHDVVRAVPERVLHQVADGGGGFPQFAGLEADGVRLVDAEFQRVFDGDDALGRRQERDEGVQHRRLARPGAARHQHVPALGEGSPGGVQDDLGQRTGLHQVLGAETALPEAADGDGDGGRGRRHADRDALRSC
ncbi:MAG: hypothetical protein OXI83_02020 [Gemmatimonadota bacterium]|nr:hypothetical protein [Gemmatimonadota bacterium]